MLLSYNNSSIIDRTIHNLYDRITRYVERFTFCLQAHAAHFPVRVVQFSVPVERKQATAGRWTIFNLFGIFFPIIFLHYQK